MNCLNKNCCGNSPQIIIEFNPVNLEIEFNPVELEFEIGTPIIKEYIEAEPYTGDYDITPTEEIQILQTEKKQMINNVIIQPIPLNYGRITRNGSIIIIT